MPDLQEVYRFIRKLFLMWQVHRWSKIAQRCIRNYDPYGVQDAIAQYNDLKSML